VIIILESSTAVRGGYDATYRKWEWSTTFPGAYLDPYKLNIARNLWISTYWNLPLFYPSKNK
jgi:hypothetical protein